MGPLTPKKAGHRLIIVMTDLYIKLMRAVPVGGIAALQVEKVVLEDWIIPEGTLMAILTDDGK